MNVNAGLVQYATARLKRLAAAFLFSSLLTNEMTTPKTLPCLRSLTEAQWPAGCSERPSSKAAASEDRRRTLWGTLRI